MGTNRPRWAVRGEVGAASHALMLRPSSNFGQLKGTGQLPEPHAKRVVAGQRMGDK